MVELKDAEGMKNQRTKSEVSENQEVPISVWFKRKTGFLPGFPTNKGEDLEKQLLRQKREVE